MIHCSNMLPEIRTTAKSSQRYWLLLSTIIITVSACNRKITETGKASYYADSFDGKRTASGEIFRQKKLSAAHKTLPFGTRVNIINIANGKSVKVRINDRGPRAPGRIVDVSQKAASRLGMLHTGVANVEIVYKKKKKRK